MPRISLRRAIGRIDIGKPGDRLPRENLTIVIQQSITYALLEHIYKYEISVEEMYLRAGGIFRDIEVTQCRKLKLSNDSIVKEMCKNKLAISLILGRTLHENQRKAFVVDFNLAQIHKHVAFNIDGATAELTISDVLWPYFDFKKVFEHE